MENRSRRRTRRRENVEFVLRNVRRRIRYEDEDEIENVAESHEEEEPVTHSLLEDEAEDSSITPYLSNIEETEPNFEADGRYIRNETESSSVQRSTSSRINHDIPQRYSQDEYTPLSSRYERSYVEQHEQQLSQQIYDEGGVTDLWGLVRNVVDDSVNASNIGTAALLDPLNNYAANSGFPSDPSRDGRTPQNDIAPQTQSDEDSITGEYRAFSPILLDSNYGRHRAPARLLQTEHVSRFNTETSTDVPPLRLQAAREDTETIEDEDEQFNEISVRWYPRVSEDDSMPRPNISRDTRSAQRRAKENETNAALLNEIYGENVIVQTAFSSYHPEAVRLWHATVFCNLCLSFTDDGAGDSQRMESLRRDAMILDSTISLEVARAMNQEALYEAMDNQVLWALTERYGENVPAIDTAKFRDVYIAVSRVSLLQRYAQHCSRNKTLIDYAVRKLSPKQYATMLRRDRLKDQIPLRFGLFVQLLMERSHVPTNIRQNFRYRNLMPESLLSDYRRLFERPLPNRVFAAAARPKYTEHSYRDTNGAYCAEEPNFSSTFYSDHSETSEARSKFTQNTEQMGAWGTLWSAMNEAPFERSNRYRIFDETYASRTKRIESYSQTRNPVIRALCETLADSGFFCLADGNYVRCFTCGGTLSGWNEYSNPIDEHARFFPRCDYLYRMLTDQNVYYVWMVRMLCCINI